MPIVRVPQVDRILRHPQVAKLLGEVRRDMVVHIIRRHLDSLRSGQAAEEMSCLDNIAAAVCAQARRLQTPLLTRVINGTGVVLNTNLGRAPLSQAALQQASAAAAGYCNLEIDLESGKRGERGARIEELLQLLTGAEAALAVNNNAAAVVLCVNALSRAKEVIVSRGELVEIGGSFRLPDVIEAAGGILKEVGTTNRTRASDYRLAISECSGMILRCHRSNFAITGFTCEATLEELSAISAETRVPLVEDLGSGVLLDLSAFHEGNEPTVPQVVASGCDLVCFSGDKLLGGPQAGIIVGKHEHVSRLRRHPLYRALRLDKVTLSLLECTLIAYLHPEAQQLLPALAKMTEPVIEIKRRAEQFCRTAGSTFTKVKCESVPTRATAGGGALPGEELQSAGVRITVPGMSAGAVSQALRGGSPPVVGIVQDDSFILDFRTMFADDIPLLLSALQQLDLSST